MAKIIVLNVLGQDARERIGLAMDSAGLAFVPKSVLVFQDQKVISPARYNFVNLAHSFSSYY